jgi:hypothetical protein
MPPTWPLPFRFSNQNSVSISHLFPHSTLFYVHFRDRCHIILNCRKCSWQHLLQHSVRKLNSSLYNNPSSHVIPPSNTPSFVWTDDVMVATVRNPVISGLYWLEIYMRAQKQWNFFKDTSSCKGLSI